MITFKVDNLINMNSALQVFLDFLQKQKVTEDALFNSRLVSCELITNVVRHTGKTAVFTGEIKGEIIEIRVKSDSPEKIDLNVTLPDVFAEHGRGLYIIKSICFGDVEQANGEIKVNIKA